MKTNLIYSQKLVNAPIDVVEYYFGQLQLADVQSKIDKLTKKIANAENRLENETDKDKADNLQKIIDGAMAEREPYLAEREIILGYMAEREYKKAMFIDKCVADGNKATNVENIIRLTLCAKSLKSCLRYAVQYTDTDKLEHLAENLNKWANDYSDMDIMPKKALSEDIKWLISSNLYLKDTENTNKVSVKVTNEEVKLIALTFVKSFKADVKAKGKKDNKALVFEGYTVNTVVKTNKKTNEKDYSGLLELVSKVAVKVVC